LSDIAYCDGHTKGGIAVIVQHYAALTVDSLYCIPADVVQIPTMMVASDYTHSGSTVNAVDDTASGIPFCDDMRTIPDMRGCYTVYGFG